MLYLPFRDVPIGAYFESGRRIWRKRSSRTADSPETGWFYFRQTEPVFILP